MAEFNAKIRKLPDSVVINVNLEYTPEYHIRRWLAVRLIILAGLILGCTIRVSGLGDAPDEAEWQMSKRVARE